MCDQRSEYVGTQIIHHYTLAVTVASSCVNNGSLKSNSSLVDIADYSSIISGLLIKKRAIVTDYHHHHYYY